MGQEVLNLVLISTAYFVAGSDTGKFTIKAIDDVRTLNKNVHFRAQSNLFNINELASLWEEKIGRTLPRITMTEDDLLTATRGLNSNFVHVFFVLKKKKKTSSEYKTSIYK